MAAAILALRRTPPFFTAFSSQWVPAVLAATSLSIPKATWSMPSLQSLLELFPPFLLAVPKSKTSHSRKAMRSANKGLKDKQNITNCPACGGVKLAHHVCANCYSELTRKWKAKQRQEGSDIPDLS
ncbi:hypothetical protein BJ165DRAFT_489084 [Panaeolus papilionaceus]|nr:hypothetical protein BJ165DRAFT_489084 [Panaeolus papilionaceus]